MIILHYLYHIKGFTNVNNHQQVSIDSNHSIGSLLNPIFLIFRSNQFPITIEHFLFQYYSKQSFGYYWWIKIIIICEYLLWIVRSMVILIVMMVEKNGRLIERTIIIQYHCKNGKEKQHDQAERIDILIIIESCTGIKNIFVTINQSIKMFLING